MSLVHHFLFFWIVVKDEVVGDNGEKGANEKIVVLIQNTITEQLIFAK